MKFNKPPLQQKKFRLAVCLLVVCIVLTLLAGCVASATPFSKFILMLRINRELIALCCGGMLATGSAILQGLTRNPMVAPDLTGMTSIGCLLIVLCEILHGSSPALNILLGIIGAVSGFLLCLAFARHQHRLAIVLTGITISFSATAFMQLLILTYPQRISDLLHFLNGSLYASDSGTMLLIVSITLCVVPIAFLLSKRFSVFALDQATSRSIGVPFLSYQLSCFGVAAILIGASITGLGNMGFLGIVAPNLARKIVGQRPHYVFPLSFLIGGLLYLLADTLGCCLISPAEIPAGIMSNMITAPVFLYVLLHFSRGQHGWN